jgi:membrane-bound lytic murein transglycosylase B
MTEGN